MNKNSSMKAGSLYLFASLFNKGIAFLTVPIFTRLLSTSDYGIVTTYSSWASILTAVLGMSLNTAIRLSRGIDCTVKIEKNRELSSVFSFTLLSGIVAFGFLLSTYIIFPINVSLIVLGLCYFEGLFTSLITDYTYYQMMENKFVGRTILMIFPNLLAAVFSIVLICNFENEKYMGRIIPLALVHIIIGIIVCGIVYYKHKPCIEKNYIKWALRVSLPLIVHGVALNILSQADRTMISAMRDTSETGIYSLVYSFSMIATVITTGLEGVWVPWFTKKLNCKEERLIQCASKDYICFMTYAMIGIILVSPEILKWMAPVEYWEGIIIIPPLVISNFIIFAYTLYVNIEYYYEKTTFITINTVVAAVLNIVLNFIFIPRFGYVAAAFTTLGSYFMSFVLHYRYAKKLNANAIMIKEFLLPSLEIICVVVCFYIFIESTWSRIIILALSMCIALWLEKKRVRFYFEKIKGGTD